PLRRESGGQRTSAKPGTVSISLWSLSYDSPNRLLALGSALSRKRPGRFRPSTTPARTKGGRRLFPELPPPFFDSVLLQAGGRLKRRRDTGVRGELLVGLPQRCRMTGQAMQLFNVLRAEFPLPQSTPQARFTRQGNHLP